MSLELGTSAGLTFILLPLKIKKIEDHVRYCIRDDGQFIKMIDELISDLQNIKKGFLWMRGLPND